MKVIVQRTQKASVDIDGQTVGQIEQGFLMLVGITHEDTSADVAYIAKKVANLRVFSDEQGKMNLSIQDIDGAIIVPVSSKLHILIWQSRCMNCLTKFCKTNTISL